MSTAMDNIAGKGRNLSTNALVGIAGRFAGRVRRQHRLLDLPQASRLSGASGAASRPAGEFAALANQGREAVGGNADSFAAFKATKDRDRQRHQAAQRPLRRRRGRVSPIKTVTATRRRWRRAPSR